MFLNKFLKLRYFIHKTTVLSRPIGSPSVVATELDEKPIINKSIIKHTTKSVRTLYKGMPYEPVSVERSIEYMKSPEYKQVYLDKPVWFFYRRNFKGHYAPQKTKKNCVTGGKVTSRHACPVCRDNHLILSYKHLVLLKQFIDPFSGEAFPANTTGLCQKQHENLLFNMQIAVQLGLIEVEVPFRLYDYSEYYDSVPSDLEQVSVSFNTDDVILPGAAKLFSVVEEFVDTTPPPVPNRYQVEEKEYLEKRAKKMAQLKEARLNR